MKTAIQLDEVSFTDHSEAETAANALLMLHGVIGVRVLKPSPAKPGYRVLGYMQDEPKITPEALATIAARRVLLIGLYDMRTRLA